MLGTTQEDCSEVRLNPCNLVEYSSQQQSTNFLFLVFLSSQETFTSTDHILIHKTSHNILKSFQIRKGTFYDHDDIKSITESYMENIQIFRTKQYFHITQGRGKKPQLDLESILN